MSPLSNPALANAKRMIGMIKAARNPQAMLAQLIQNNPTMVQVQTLIQENGNDPKKAFYALAEKQGVDPNEILKMLQ